VEDFIGANFKDPEDWERNFKASKARGQVTLFKFKTILNYFFQLKQKKVNNVFSHLNLFSFNKYNFKLKMF
jgi:hypothetical protein